MAGFKIDIDISQFRRNILAVGAGYRAIEETIRLQGAGETITSRRKKNEYEKKRPDHGRLIAWMFREKLGVDPFEESGPEFEAIVDQMADDVLEAITFAYVSERPQPERIKQALKKAAEFWAEAVQDRIENGELGTNRKKYDEKKKALVKYMGDVISQEYGALPPRGILTERFIKGIRSRWRQGRI